MSSKVSLKVTAFRKSFEAGIALIRFLSRVSPLMNLQSTGSHESLITKLAFEGSFTRMPPHMVCQMSLCCEGLSAAIDRADKRFLSGMDPHVSLEISFFRESSFASSLRARKGLFPRLNQ